MKSQITKSYATDSSHRVWWMAVIDQGEFEAMKTAILKICTHAHM